MRSPSVPEPGPATVVIVHRNQPGRLAASVAAFHAQTVPTSIVVVDNASGPETRRQLQELALPVRLVRAGSNLGFGPAANLGLRRWLRSGAGEWVVVAPHDALPAPDTLARMLCASGSDETVGLASADVGDGARPVIEPFLGFIGVPSEVDEGFEDADYPHGTLLMARRACLEQIGVFDERYFAYCEEADLGIRARRAGWRVGVVRGALVANPGMTSSTALVAYLQHRNTLLLQKEHFGRWNAIFRMLWTAGQLLVGFVHRPARGLHWSPRGRMLGMIDHMRGRYGSPPECVHRPEEVPSGLDPAALHRHQVSPDTHHVDR